MRRRYSNEGEGEEQINLTPMLDVVFIMLIFFIVTATFVKEVGLDVNQPDQDKPKTVVSVQDATARGPWSGQCKVPAGTASVVLVSSF